MSTLSGRNDSPQSDLRQTALAVLSLFASFSTLVCCALPALLITLGLGAAVAGLTANFPALIWLSQHKTALFIITGALLVTAGLVRRHGLRHATCPIDPVKARACTGLKKLSTVFFRLAVVLYAIGFLFAFFGGVLFF